MEQHPDKTPKRSRKRTWIVIAVVILAIFLAGLCIYKYEMSMIRYDPDPVPQDGSKSIDTASIGVDTTRVAVDTTKRDSARTFDPTLVPPHHEVDSLKKADSDRKFATLGYHYYPAMNIHETQEINVFLSASNIQSAIRDTIIKILEDEDPDRDPSDTGKIAFKEHIPLYKFVTVDLVPLDSGIIVRKTPDAPRQAVDTLAGNRWSWTIFAKSAEKAESKLLLIVYSEDPSRIEKRIIRIQIHVETNFIRLFINYLSEHPGDALFKIVVPLATFFGGLLAGRKKKQEKPSNDSERQGSSD